MRLHVAIVANEHILSRKFLKYGMWTLKRVFSVMKVDYSTSVGLMNKSKTDDIKDIIPFMKEKIFFENNYYSVMQNY